MAQPILCDTECGELATCMITMIDLAETKAFCPTCFGDFAHAFLAAYRPEALAPPPAKPPRKRAAKPAPAVADDKTGGETDASADKTAAGAAAG